MDRNVRIIEPPAPIVTWEEMKTHAKIEDEADKAYVETLIAAATSWIDGPSGWLGRALGVQVLEVQLRSWPCEDEAGLPYPPEIEIISVRYIDPQGVEQNWPVPASLYWGDPPSVRGNDGDVKIRYRAGYGSKNGADPPVWTNAVPAPIKVAIMMMVSQWYRTREPVAIGGTVETLPFAVDALLQPFRIYR